MRLRVAALHGVRLQIVRTLRRNATLVGYSADVRITFVSVRRIDQRIGTCPAALWRSDRTCKCGPGAYAAQLPKDGLGGSRLQLTVLCLLRAATSRRQWNLTRRICDVYARRAVRQRTRA